jgi:hypothetical protein
MEIPARKVFWEATPVAEVAVPVPQGRASSVLRRADAALIPPEILKSSIAYGAKGNNQYIAVHGRFIVERTIRILRSFLRKESSVLRSLLDFAFHVIVTMLDIDYNTGGLCPSRE